MTLARRHTPLPSASLFRSLTVVVLAAAMGCGGGGSSSPTSPSPAPTAVAGVVTVVAMSVSSVSLTVSQKTTVTATVRDGLGTTLSSKTVTWSTSDGSVVGGAVNGNSAELEAVGAGAATVTAAVDGVTGSIAVQVAAGAPAAVYSVTIAPSSAAIGVGEQLPLVATLRDVSGNFLSGRQVTWTTSNTAIANGVVNGATATITGVAPGVATITATSEGRVGTTLVVVGGSSGGSISLTCSGLAGGSVYGYDGQYLGRLTNQFDAQSILNQFGSYGSQFSSTSMYNQFSNYGSQFNSLSAFNSLASTPPQLYVSGRVAAYVTKNTLKSPRVDPAALRTCSFP